MKLIRAFLRLSSWAKFWTSWAGVGAVAESYALWKHNPKGTLSWQMWLLRAKHKGQGLYTLLLMGMLWGLIHFWKEGRDIKEDVKAVAEAVGVEVGGTE